MKTRREAARFIEKQLNNDTDDLPSLMDKYGRHHYGAQELRQLLDFIYDGPPALESERIALKAPSKDVW